MSQADLGVRVFLIDNLTSPMGLVSSAMGFFASGLLSGMSQVEGMSSRLAGLGTEAESLSAKQQRLVQDAEDMGNAYAQGLIPLQDYGAFMNKNAEESAALDVQMAANAEQATALTGQISSLTGTLYVMAGALGAGIDFAAFTSGISTADQNAADLTDTLNNLSIAGNLTNQQLGNMQTYLMGVANTSIYTADTTAQGFTMLMEKGQSADDVMNGMGQDAVNLAEALGEQGVANSAELLAGTLQMFNLKASDSKKTADMLTYAFYNGIPSVAGLNQALNATGGMASALNVPLSEVIVMLDALGKAGLSGSQAGTALRYILQSMYEPTQKQANELQTLGIITANQVTPAFQKLYAQLKAGDSSLPTFDGTVNGLYNIFEAAKKAGEVPASATFLQWADSVGMLSNKFYDAHGREIDFMSAFGILVEQIKAHSKTPQDFADTLAQMFNVRSGQGFADILGHVNNLTDAQKKLLLSTENQGLAAEDAGKKMNSQNSQAKALSTTWTDFLALTGQPFQNFGQLVLGGLNNLLGGFTTGSPQVHQFFTGFLVSGAIMSGLALIIGIVIAVFTLFGGVLAPIIGVVLGVAAGIAALAAIGTGLFMVFQHMGLFKVLGDIIKEVWGSFETMLGPVLKQLQSAWNDLLAAIKPVLPVLGGIAAFIAGMLFGVFSGLVGVIAAVAHAFLFVLGGAFNAIAGLIRFVVGIVQVVVNVVKFFFGLLTGNGPMVDQAIMGIVDAFKRMGQGILGFFAGIGKMFMGLLQGVFGGILAFFDGFIKGVVGFFQHLFDVLVGHSIIPDLIHSIWNWFLNLLELPGKVVGGLVTGFINAAGNLLGAINDHVIQPLIKAFEDLPGKALQWAGNMISMFIQGIEHGLHNLLHSLGWIGDRVSDMLGFHSPTREGPLSKSGEWMPNMMNMLAQGVLDNAPKLQSAALHAANLLHGAFNSPGISATQSTYATANTLLNGGNTTIPLQIDGQTVSQIVLNRISGQLVMSGANRMLR